LSFWGLEEYQLNTHHDTSKLVMIEVVIGNVYQLYCTRVINLACSLSAINYIEQAFCPKS